MSGTEKAKLGWASGSERLGLGFPVSALQTVWLDDALLRGRPELAAPGPRRSTPGNPQS